MSRNHKFVIALALFLLLRTLARSVLPITIEGEGWALGIFALISFTFGYALAIIEYDSD